MPPNQTRARAWLVTVAIAAGAAIGAAGIASAATSGQSSSTTAPTANTPRPDPSQVAHGPGETLLTGTTAANVKAAALAAVPGGSIIRVETDSEGSPYEAHVKKADGSIVTVKVDKDFKVTKTESGFGGPGPQGAGGPPPGRPTPGAPPRA
jgi:hypothetical protein